MLCAVDIFYGVFNFFKNLGSFVVENSEFGLQPTDLTLILALGGFIIYCVFAFIRGNLSYEFRMAKTLSDFNAYFIKNPTINNQNLKEFNSKMKNVPKPVRVQWQLYMLYRDKKPSEYLSLENCLERPMKFTSYKTSIRNAGVFYNVYLIFVTIFVAAGILYNTIDASIGVSVFNIMILPALFLILKWLFVVFMNLRYDATVGDMFANYGLFQRGLDKACTTLPAYIDYEMLFTKKEIRQSVPVLQDYIERRELREKEELEKAKENQIEHEKYDFSAIGFNASVMLDRTMRECESFINHKKRISYAISQKKDEIASLTKNYEEMSKEHIKQQQISKENLERLRYSAETSTNRVEAGRIAKQQEEELKRQEQAEKDAESAYQKYIAQKEVLEQNIAELEKQLDNRKHYIENVIMAEFDTFVTKINSEVDAENNKKYEAIISDMKEDNEILSDDIKEKIIAMETAGLEVKPNSKMLAKQERKRLEEEQNKLRQELENEKRMEEANQDLKNGDNNLEDESNETNTNNEQVDKKVENQTETSTAKTDNEEIQYDEFGGYYDKDGKYIYEDGSYYDTEGNYYDANGNLVIPSSANGENVQYDEYGGYYDENNNYVYEDGSYYDAEGNYYDANGNLVQTNNATEQMAGNYDANGNYVYEDGSYYDANGNYYDANGNLVSPNNGGNV